MADSAKLLEAEFDNIDESLFEVDFSSIDHHEEGNNVAERHKFAKDFSFRQIGAISQYIEPVSIFHPIEYVLKIFVQNPDIQALPVEEYNTVVGYIDRASMEEATKNAFRRFILKDTRDYVKRVPLIIYAREFCDLCLAKIASASQKYNASFFPVFDYRKSFHGLATLDDLIERISRIGEQDMNRARTIQQGIMPDNTDLRKLPFAVSAWNQMATKIGGDLYSIYRITDTKYIVGCFDVSGKGVAAALVTVALGSFFSALKRFPQIVSTPEKIISELDYFIKDTVPLEIFVTAGIFYIDLESRRLSVFNCGHTNIYFFVPHSAAEKGKTIRVSEIEAFLPPLGMGAAADDLVAGNVKIPCCAIEKGLKAALYSDGLTDMQTKEGVRYGDSRVKNLFKSLYSSRVDAFSKKIEEAVIDWTDRTLLADDITVLNIAF